MALSEAEVERACVRTSEILAPDTALPALVIQAAVRQALEETVLSRQRQQAPPQAEAGNGAGAVAYQIPEQLPLLPKKSLELVFVHECRNHGCNSGACVLCKHNPAKRCTGNFAHKYWVGDKLLAKCEGAILVELINADTGERCDSVAGMRIEVCILDGNKYTSRCREMGEQRLDILDECEVLRNQRNEPLLVAGNANNDAENPQVVLKLPHNAASVCLRDMKVTESSESVLAGTKRPPFRLVCRALSMHGTRLPVQPAVSEEFVVVTKRTKNLKKQEIPSLDDPISKLNHIGKETVKKLNELKAAADEAQLPLPVPPELYRITKVRQFQQLALLSEADGHLQQRIKQLLKLSKEKWDAACEHAKTAVQVDNRMRAWYQKDMAVGLLYTCALGEVQPDQPVALIQTLQASGGGNGGAAPEEGANEEGGTNGGTNGASGGGPRAVGAEGMKIIPCEHQLPQQREQVQQIAEIATRCWWEPQHPGWMIFTLGNQHFQTMDHILKFSQADNSNPLPREASEDATASDEGHAAASRDEAEAGSAMRSLHHAHGEAGARGGEAGSLNLEGSEALLMGGLPTSLDGLGQLNVSSLLRRYLHASMPSPSLPVRSPLGPNAILNPPLGLLHVSSLLRRYLHASMPSFSLPELCPPSLPPANGYAHDLPQHMPELPGAGQFPGAAAGAGGENPFESLTERVFVGDRPQAAPPEGTLVRPVPSTDPMAIMAALNWQSQGLKWNSSLTEASSALPAPSCFSLGVNGLMKIGSLGSLGLSGGLSRLPSSGGSFGLPRLSHEFVKQAETTGLPPASGPASSPAPEGNMLEVPPRKRYKVDADAEEVDCQPK